MCASAKLVQKRKSKNVLPTVNVDRQDFVVVFFAYFNFFFIMLRMGQVELLTLIASCDKFL